MGVLHLTNFWGLFPAEGREITLHASRKLPEPPVPAWSPPRASRPLGNLLGGGSGLEGALWGWVISGGGERGCHSL